MSWPNNHRLLAVLNSENGRNSTLLKVIVFYLLILIQEKMAFMKVRMVYMVNLDGRKSTLKKIRLVYLLILIENSTLMKFIIVSPVSLDWTKAMFNEGQNGLHVNINFKKNQLLRKVIMVYLLICSKKITFNECENGLLVKS